MIPRPRPASRPLARAAPALVALGVAFGLAGCGSGSAPGAPSARGLPLAGGARVTASVRRCDGGAHPFCARELVLVAGRGRYPSSGALEAAEAGLLSRAGWATSNGDTTLETAEESPGHRLRVTFATAEHDLMAIEDGRIDRAGAVALALSSTLYERRPALSLILQAGST